MVHALHEIQRVLVPGGILIDLRPLAGRWPVEVVNGQESRVAGHAIDLPAGVADDQAADRSIQQASENGWFVRERREFFPFFYYWDSPKEMQEYVDQEWKDFTVINEEDWKNIRSMWAVANADARLRVRVTMLIGRWKKSDR